MYYEYGIQIGYRGQFGYGAMLTLYLLPLVSLSFLTSMRSINPFCVNFRIALRVVLIDILHSSAICLYPSQSVIALLFFPWLNWQRLRKTILVVDFIVLAIMGDTACLLDTVVNLTAVGVLDTVVFLSRVWEDFLRLLLGKKALSPLNSFFLPNISPIRVSAIFFRASSFRGTF